MRSKLLSVGISLILAAAFSAAVLAGDAGSSSDGGGVADTIEQRDPTPRHIVGAITASATEASQAIAACNGRVRILDVRDRASFDKGHVPGAMWVAARTSQVTRNTRVAIGRAEVEPACVTLVYGANDRDAVAPTAVQVAVAGGHRNVHWLRGGFAEWRNARLPVE